MSEYLFSVLNVLDNRCSTSSGNDFPAFPDLSYPEGTEEVKGIYRFRTTQG